MRRAAVLVMATIALAACARSGSAQPAAHVSPTAIGVASPTPSAESSPSSTQQSSPSTVADLPLSAAPFTCTLPVETASGPGGVGTTFTGGFVTFPSAQYTSDPNGVIQERPQQNDFATQALPYLYGIPQVGAPFYDRARNRWLPVGSGQTSPDGSTYAYAAYPTQIHLVTVATGADRIVEVTPPTAGAAVGWEVGDYDGSAVYLLGEQIDQLPRGIWRVDATTGALSQMSAVANVLLVRNGQAYVGVVNPADPSPPRSPRNGVDFDSIAQVDLATGHTTTWIYRPGQSVALIGVDKTGGVVVSVAPGPDFDTSHGTVGMITTPGSQPLTMTTGSISLFEMQPDVGHDWFGNERGIYLWTGSAGLTKVFAFQADATQSQAILPAGRCV